MWDYTEKMMEHFRNPRNVGTIEDPDGVGEVGSMACGDALKLMFKLGDDGKIADVKYQTFGCGSAIASSSALSEMLIGKTLEEAKEISNQNIADFLGGLPKQKMHCSVMGRDALVAAIENYETGADSKKITDEDANVVCNCFGVTEEEIERAVRENNLTTLEEVTNFTKAGGGCSNCHYDIEQILERINNGDKPEVKEEKDAAKKKKRLTNIQKIQMIQETIDREIRPSLKKDGGDIELVDVDGNQVVVSLRGTCNQCRMAGVTLEKVVETKIREFVSDELRVIEERALED
jgi:NifU-like protein